jgi:hypothetical protein
MSNIETTTNDKPWWQSKTIIGAAVAMVATVASLAGKTIAPEIQGQIVDLIVAVGGIFGSTLAVIGRLTAKADLK